VRHKCIAGNKNGKIGSKKVRKLKVFMHISEKHILTYSMGQSPS